MMLQNHKWVGEPFKIQDRILDANIAEFENFIDILSKYHIQNYA